jgi:two-component system KDP operon response regulator KdpE
VTTVLVSDPDPRSRRLAARALRLDGYTVESIGTSAHISSRLRRRRPDAVILDPVDGDSVEVVSALRAQTDVPILVIGVSGDEQARVAALDAGADDYLSKPFGVEELLARLRVALRRARSTQAEDEPIVTKDFTIHLADRRWVRSDGDEVRLTPIEWRLVEMLVRRPGHLVTQSELLEGVWGPKALNKSNYLRVQVAGIRRKVEPEPARPRYFITAPGLGLRFQPKLAT